MPLATAARHYQSLLDGSLDAVIIVDAQGRCVAANAAAAAMLGYEENELLQLALPSLVARGHTWAAVEPACFLVEGQWQGEILVRHKEGALLAVDAWSAGLSHPAGNAWILFLRNPTSRAPDGRSENATNAANALRAASTIVTTLDGVIAEWGPSAEQLYGYLAAEVTGHSLDMLAPPELADDMAALLLRVRCGKRVTAHPTTQVTKQGRRLDVSVAISPLRDASGAVAAAQLTVCGLGETSAAKTAPPDAGNAAHRTGRRPPGA